MKKSVDFKTKCGYTRLSRSALWIMAAIFSVCIIGGCAEKKSEYKRPVHAKVNVDRSRVISPVILSKPKPPDNKNPTTKKSIAKNARGASTKQAVTTNKSKANQVAPSKKIHSQVDANTSAPADKLAERK